MAKVTSKVGFPTKVTYLYTIDNQINAYHIIIIINIMLNRNSEIAPYFINTLKLWYMPCFRQRNAEAIPVTQYT